MANAAYLVFRHRSTLSRLHRIRRLVSVRWGRTLAQHRAAMGRVDAKSLRYCYRPTTLSIKLSRIVPSLGWGLDAMLQAGLNSMVSKEQSRDEFVALLERALYDELLAKADAEGLGTILARAINYPKSNKVDDACVLYLFLEKHFGSESLFTVARWLRRAFASKNRPVAVLTFNADGLLDLVLTLLATHEMNQSGGAPRYPKDEFYRVLRASDNLKSAVPIYFLHGCITPRVKNRKRLRESRENLVFPESGYSRISSTVFTWQQTIFLSHAQSQRLVFIGLSMSDPNLRRWLSWCTASIAQEEQERAQPPKHGEYIRGRNLWITTRPQDPNHAFALENSLLHLGTRIGWLNSWTELPDALNNLSGL
jgi:hypothetical protein